MAEEDVTKVEVQNKEEIAKEIADEILIPFKKSIQSIASSLAPPTASEPSAGVEIPEVKVTVDAPSTTDTDFTETIAAIKSTSETIVETLKENFSNQLTSLNSIVSAITGAPTPTLEGIPRTEATAPSVPTPIAGVAGAPHEPVADAPSTALEKLFKNLISVPIESTSKTMVDTIQETSQSTTDSIDSMMTIQTEGAAAEKAVALETRREGERTSETRHSEFIDAIEGIKLAVAPKKEEGGILGFLLMLLGFTAAGALGLASGLLVGWISFVAKMLADLGRLVGKGLKKLSPKWLDDFFKAFTKEGKLAQKVMGIIKKFKMPTWVDDFFKAFTKEGKLAQKIMKVIDNFKMPKFLDDFFKAFTKDGKLAQKVMKIIDNFKMPKFNILDNITKFFKGAFPKSFGQLADSVADIKKALPGAKGGVFTRAMDGVKSVFKFFARIGKTIMAPIKAIMGVTKKVTGFTSILKQMGGVFKFMATIGKAIAAPLTIIMGIIDGFFESKDAVSKSEGIMATMVNAVIGAIGGFIDGAIFQLLDLLKSGVSWIAGFFGFDEVEKFLDSFSFSKMFNDFLDDVYKWFNTLFSDPVKALTQLVKAIFGGYLDLNSFILDMVKMPLVWLMELF